MPVASALTVRFRVDFGSRCSVGAGKVELLEGIARTGSRALKIDAFTALRYKS